MRKPGKYRISFHDVVAEDAKLLDGRPWFPDRTKYGPFTALTSPEPELALLLDEQGQPLWGGARIIPMHVKGRLNSLVLVEQVRVGQGCYTGMFQLLEDDYRPFCRFIRLSMHVAEDELKASPLESLGKGFLTEMVNGDTASCVMDVSGKGDDLLGAVILKGLGRWDDILVTEEEAEEILGLILDQKRQGVSRPRHRLPLVCSWNLVAMDAWGGRVLNTLLPEDAKPLNVSIRIKTSPKITLSALNRKDRSVWRTISYDPDTFTERAID